MNELGIDKLTQKLIDPARIQGHISGETRALMAQMLEPPSSPLLPPPPPLLGRISPSSSFSQPSPPTPSSIFPSLVGLIERVLDELESQLSKLLSLNPSRRDAILQHLNLLAGLSSQTTAQSGDPFMSGLRAWLENTRTPAQSRALRCYFEEVALIALSQAIVLKAWADRGLRPLSSADLGKLNWALNSTLRPHVPLDRDGWQITKPNIYSWYNPSPALQFDIWNTFEQWEIFDEGPQFLTTLLHASKKAEPEMNHPEGYDSRFYQTIWENLGLFGWKENADLEVANLDRLDRRTKRERMIFCPTLRDGSIVRTSLPGTRWIGMEASPFLFMFAELMQMWWTPAPPPCWTIGTGLEVHTRDQLAFALINSKPSSVLSKISEMEACDGAFVFEEQITRLQSRNSLSTKFREQIDQLPYYKKLRSAGTSLGSLQACVALSKLRPEGLLWWAREEPLGSKDGHEILHFLLNRSKLLHEWDFSHLEHTLPHSNPLFPKYLYLFQRETQLNERAIHHPIRHSISGQIRSHIEIPVVLQDSLLSAVQQTEPRGQWNLHTMTSPMAQKEWIDKWPDPTCQNKVRILEDLRNHSLPLAHFLTIRHTPDGDPKNNHQWSLPFPLKGFWVGTEQVDNGRKLVTYPLPETEEFATGSGYMVIVPEETWIAPLSRYLESSLVHLWLEHHAERKGDRWVLNEQVMKWIPIPKTFLLQLGVPNVLGENTPSRPLQLPAPWEELISEASFHPKKIEEEIEKIEIEISDELPNTDTAYAIHSAIFIRTARKIEDLQNSQQHLLSLIQLDGKIRWRNLLDILPPTECCTVTLHSRVKLSGHLPPHLPITRMDRVKSPSHGILLTTETGLAMHIGSDHHLLLQMLWGQLEKLSHPTWNELTQYLILPRKMELAESAAMDVLRSHSEYLSKTRELEELLSKCQLF